MRRYLGGGCAGRRLRDGSCESEGGVLGGCHGSGGLIFGGCERRLNLLNGGSKSAQRTCKGIYLSAVNLPSL